MLGLVPWRAIEKSSMLPQVVLSAAKRKEKELGLAKRKEKELGLPRGLREPPEACCSARRARNRRPEMK